MMSTTTRALFVNNRTASGAEQNEVCKVPGYDQSNPRQSLDVCVCLLPVTVYRICEIQTYINNCLLIREQNNDLVGAARRPSDWRSSQPPPPPPPTHTHTHTRQLS